MRTGLRMLTALLTVGVSTTVLSADQVVPTLDTERFMVGQLPAASASGPERERAAAVNGSLYAVVAPVYASGPFRSYLRLINGGGSTATFSVTVVGARTATVYGTKQYVVPTAAAWQLFIDHIVNDAGAGIRDPQDTEFSLYIQSPEPLAGYQHVTLHYDANYFENASVCKHTIQNVVSAASNQMILTNIHTTDPVVAAYPSAVELHNYANAPITYRFYVRESFTGALVGQMDFPAAANASYTIPWATIQNQVGWSPMPGEPHANLIVTDPSGAPPAIVLGQSIINNELGVSLNMTTACAVNAPAAGGGGDPGGELPGGGISY